MALTSPETPFNEHGWGLLIAEMARLRLLIKGSNDLNADSASTSQEVTNLATNLQETNVTVVIDGLPRSTAVALREVDVCVDGVRKTMFVMGTEPM